MNRLGKKKIVFGLLIVFDLIVLIKFTGCSQNESIQYMDYNTADEVKTFTFYNVDGSADSWTNPVAKAITDATGVALKTEYPVDQSESGISLMIATSNYPDIIFAKGDADELIEVGALIDLCELIDEYGPNIKKLYGDYYERLTYSAQDPAIYQLCSSGMTNEIYTTSGTAQIQYAVLEENDYRIPYTLEEYGEMIKEYKEKYPEIDGEETIGISLVASDWRWIITLSNPSGYIANGSQDNGQWIIDDANGYKATYKHLAEGQKAYFQWMNRMYQEGLLDAEFATQTYEDYLEKISSGRVLGIMDSNWSYNNAVRSLKQEGKYDRTYASLPVTMDEDMVCASLNNIVLSIGWGIGITTACEDPVKAIQFLDYICSEEGQILIQWGIEGVNYLVDEEGKRYRTKDEIQKADHDNDYSLSTGVGQYTYPFPRYSTGVADSTGNPFSTDTKQSTIDRYHIAEKKALDAWGVSMLTDIFPQADEFEAPAYAPIWSMYLPSEFKQKISVLDNIAWSGLVTCVICSEDEFDEKWESFQNALIDAGALEMGTYLTEQVQKQVDFWTKK